MNPHDPPHERLRMQRASLSVNIITKGLLEIIDRNIETSGVVNWNEVREFLRSPACQKIFEREQLNEQKSNDPGPGILQRTVSVISEQDLSFRPLKPDKGTGYMALHLICNYDPPLDVVIYVIDADSSAVSVRAPINGMLPLHAAIAFGASLEVIQYLLKKHPDALNHLDSKGSTPLHCLFMYGQAEREDVNALLVLLTNESSVIASVPNSYGHRPLHLASAAGISNEAFMTLHNAYPDGVKMKDNLGSTSLHLATANASLSPHHRHIIKILIEKNPSARSDWDRNGHTPLRLLAEKKDKLTEVQKSRIIECFESYLNLESDYSADFLVACLNFPEWLRDKVMMRNDIRQILDKKAARRFPSLIMFFDIFFVSLLLVCQRKTAYFFIETVSGSEDEYHFDSYDAQYFAFILSLCYLLLREMLQLYAMSFLGAHIYYFSDLGNWIDLGAIGLSTVQLAMIHIGTGLEAFKFVAATATFMIWLATIFYLRGLSANFALFVDGVQSIIKTLLIFLIAMIAILVLFAQSFFTIYQGTETCLVALEAADKQFNFCSFGSSLFKVYGMLIGSIETKDFYESPTSKIFFVLFGFFVIIVLLNVLIAIVSQTWNFQNDKVVTLFWFDRLEFLVEMEALLYPFRRISDYNNQSKADYEDPFEEVWDQMSEHLADSENAIYVRFSMAIAIMLWILAGIPSATLLWPPQVREFILSSGIVDDNVDNADKKMITTMDSTNASTDSLTDAVEEAVKQINSIHSVADRTENFILEVKDDVQELKRMLYELTSRAKSKHLSDDLCIL